MSDLVGTTLLDRYFLRQAVGSGGMADVYLAWDNKRAAKMAVKVLRRDLADNARFFQMFAKEAELLRKLEHPNIVRLYEFDKDGELAFIVMDWIDGSDLRRVIGERRRPFSLDEVAYILQPVCSALNYAHENGVYHCDVKPANILLHVDGRVLLTDFGVARLATERVGGGTPQYMAPEQFSSGKVTAQSDIYALGVTIYEMFTGGQVPFRGESSNSQGSSTRDRIAWEHMNLPLPPLHQYNPNISPAIEEFLATALHKDAQQRFPTTLVMMDAFEEARARSGREGGMAQTLISFIMPKVEPTLSKPSSPPPPSRPPSPPIGREPPSRSPKRLQTQLPSTTQQLKKLIENIRLPSPPKIPQFGSGVRSKEALTGPYLLGRTGDWAQQIIPITKSGLTLGRSAQNRLRLSEGSVSRIHASLIVTRKGVYIRDENSSLGTYVNGERIAGPTRLKHGDVIRIGYYQIFEFRER